MKTKKEIQKLQYQNTTTTKGTKYWIKLEQINIKNNKQQNP